MTGDATVRLPEPEPAGPIKERMYAYRGRMVAIGGQVEWILHRLVDLFVPSSEARGAERCWEAIRADLKERQLTGGMQRELFAVAEYFRVRNLAAHSATVVISPGNQIFRMSFRGSAHNFDSITIADLQREAEQARAGYEAIQRIGQALHDSQPDVLADMNPIAKAMILGEP